MEQLALSAAEMMSPSLGLGSEEGVGANQADERSGQRTASQVAMLTAFHNRSFSELWCSYESHPHDAPHCELELTWVRTEDKCAGEGRAGGGTDPSDGRGGQVPSVFISTSLRPIDDRLRQTLEVVSCEICRARKARESHGNRISEPVAPVTVAHRAVI